MQDRITAIADAGRVLAQARAHRDAMTPREAARFAWTPGGPSVEELEARIRASRSSSAAA